MPNLWSNDDIEQLKSMSVNHESLNQIASSLGRTVASVQKKQWQLGLCSKDKNVPWSDKEIAKLQRLAGRHSAEYIGKQIGKSANAVRVKAYHLKLTLKQHPWTDDDVMLLELLAGEYPVEVISKRLNRPISAVRQKAHRESINLALNLDHYSAKALAEMLGICRNVVSSWVRSGKLQATRINDYSQGAYRISRKSFKAFYRQYKDEFPTLKKIDPVILEYVING